MTAPAFFVTGTDTEVGKTFATCALIHRARLDGIAAVGIKAIAAGTDANGHNEDVLALAAANALPLAADILNPYCFAPAIAPHIAAAEAGVNIDFARIANSVGQARQQAAMVFVEGAGGFRIPLGAAGDSADLARHLGLPVILVVGMRLGCLNHAVLTAEAILARGLPLAGWVANRIDPTMQRFSDNLASLQQLLPAPCLGVLPHVTDRDPGRIASEIRLPG